jgi:hypothetical protein
VDYLTQAHYTMQKQRPEGGDAIDIIVDLKKQLETKGIELLVVPVPGKASIYPDKCSHTAEPDPAVYQHTNRLRSDLKKRGVQVLDLHRVLANARSKNGDDGAALYMAHDTHWSGRGVALAARAVAQWIRKRPWFEQLTVDPGRYRRQAVAALRFGDIPKMTQIPGIEHLFPDESVACYQVRDAKGLYQDDDASPILLLGDSFSRVFQTDAPQAAGLIANLAFELGMPLASIVNDGGASTLVRQQLARKLEILDGKHLVIWEFVERDVRFGMQGWQPIALWPEQ